MDGESGESPELCRNCDSAKLAGKPEYYPPSLILKTK